MIPAPTQIIPVMVGDSAKALAVAEELRDKTCLCKGGQASHCTGWYSPSAVLHYQISPGGEFKRMRPESGNGSTQAYRHNYFNCSFLPVFPISARLPFMIHSFQNTESCFHTKPPTLFLPGWAFDGRILRLLKPVPAWIYPENMIDPQTSNRICCRLPLKKVSKNSGLSVGPWGPCWGLNLLPGTATWLILWSLFHSAPHWPGPEIDAIRDEFSLDPTAFSKVSIVNVFLVTNRHTHIFVPTLNRLSRAN